MHPTPGKEFHRAKSTAKKIEEALFKILFPRGFGGVETFSENCIVHPGAEVPQDQNTFEIHHSTSDRRKGGIEALAQGLAPSPPQLCGQSLPRHHKKEKQLPENRTNYKKK